RAGDVDSDSSERAVGNAALQPRPGFAGVGRFPDAAARATAVHTAGGAPALVGRGVEDFVVRRVDHEIGRARVLVHFQRLFPRLAAVGRLIYAALAAGTPQTALRCHVYPVVVARVDDDAADVAGRTQAHGGERLVAC